MCRRNKVVFRYASVLLISALVLSTTQGPGFGTAVSCSLSSCGAWPPDFALKELLQYQSGSTGARRPGAPATERKVEDQNLGRTAPPPNDSDSDANTLPDPKRKQAIDLIEGVLLRSHRISPVDYRILNDVQAALILWGIDRGRSLSILKQAVELMRGLSEKKDGSTLDRSREIRIRKLRFMVLRKIAAVDAGLVQDLLPEGDRSNKTVQSDWTDESRAIMSLATERIPEDPKSAARLFEQSLSLGAADWTSFLERLSERDNSEAERAATVLIDRLRDSFVTPIALRNLVRFVLAPDRSSSFKEHFFQSVDLRLRRDVRPDVNTAELEDDLRVAREMSRLVAVQAPQLQREFDDLGIAFEGAFAARAMASPGPAGSRTLDISATLPAKPGDTTEIEAALPKVGQISDSRVRDKQYQRLAIDAARNADTRLAEDIMSKIDNDSVRLETTALVYTPLVKKAIGESDWFRSQKLASNIHESLARTLAFDSIAQAMSKSKQDKQAIIDVYREAVRLLDRDSPNERVAKAYLTLAKPLYTLDQDRAIDVIKSSVFALNRLAIKDEALDESMVEPSATAWVRYADPSMSADEILNLPDLIMTAFEDLARRSVDNSLSVAEMIHNEGVYSMAQLAISKVLLAQVKTIPSPAQRTSKDQR